MFSGLLLFALFLPAEAFAHGSEGGFVLLLPTRFYISGGAAVVAVSFLLIAFASTEAVDQVFSLRATVLHLPPVPPAAISLVSFSVMVVAILAGLLGSPDPLENPLPLLVWTMWWIGFTLLQAVFGPLWRIFNPWTGPIAALRRAVALRQRGYFALPARLGYMIAIVQFFAFAWFELVDIAPSDPGRLAMAVLLYWLCNLAGMLLFGEKDWIARAEPFSILFGLIGALAPFQPRTGSKGVAIDLVVPGRALMERPPLPPSGVFFVLLSLSSVSFDGLSRTFFWLGEIGVNPLEFPGRSAVTISGTAGLFASFLVLSTLFFCVVAAGCALNDETSTALRASGRLIYSIVPISVAFHFAHYLTVLLVDGQYFRIVLSDPFAFGWDLFGTAGEHVTMSFMNTFEGVFLIWNTQVTAIVAGHVLGIVLAHGLSLQAITFRRAAVRSQLYLSGLMVLYTVFGLWLLATPRL